MDNAAPAPRKYLSNDTLRALVKLYRRNRARHGEGLGKALLAIAGGVWDRYRFTPDRDEFVQEVVIHLLDRPLRKADLQLHLFNYFTKCAFRFGLKLRERANSDRRRFETYAAECVDAGRRPVIDDVVGRPGADRSPLDELIASEDLAGDRAEAEEFVAWLERFRDVVEEQLKAAGPIPTIRVATPERRRRRARRRRALGRARRARAR